ncbi:MAG: hypothetical protein JEZ12_16085 [Desulfobacterium sp.]|nr:hypothetical protein [Desulfobacterium sp.]
MNNISMETKVKAFIWLIVLSVGYLYLSSPKLVVVNNSGNIKGAVNHARVFLQGESFWKKQLKIINSELQWEFAGPQRQAENKREINKILKELNQIMEETYKENPEMRPTPAERIAEKLRERADRIEEAQEDYLLEKWRLERIAELQALVPIVKTKIKK